MSNVYNIPVVSTEELIQELTNLYEAAYTLDELHMIPSVNLVGPMGVGKSSAVYTIAQNLRQRLGKPVHVTVLPLLTLTPSDLMGIPSGNEDKTRTVWLRPKIFDFPEDGLNILFLDEISTAPKSLQALAYQIALDKQSGVHKLPQDLIVISAGNRTTDKSVAFPMPKALANRMMHFEILANFDSWYEWAMTKDVDARVMGYLAFNHSKLNQEPNMEELAFPTPRSWEFVSRLLKTTGKTPEVLHTMISGCIGVSNAGEFEAWCRICGKLPAVEDILSGKALTPPRGTDVAYALVSSLLTCVRQSRERISPRELENICAYISRMPSDFACMFFRNLLKLDGMNMTLAKIQVFNAWMKKNKHLL